METLEFELVLCQWNLATISSSLFALAHCDIGPFFQKSLDSARLFIFFIYFILLWRVWVSRLGHTSRDLPPCIDVTILKRRQKNQLEKKESWMRVDHLVVCCRVIFLLSFLICWIRLLTGLASSALAPSNSRIEMSLNWAKEKGHFFFFFFLFWSWRGYRVSLRSTGHVSIGKTLGFSFNKKTSLYFSFCCCCRCSFSLYHLEGGLICLEIRLTSRSFFTSGARVVAATAAASAWELSGEWWLTGSHRERETPVIIEF